MTAPSGTRASLAVSADQDALAGEQHLAGGADGDLPVSDHALAHDGMLRIIPTRRPPGLAITGEIDESTYCTLVGALEKFTGGPGEIHINLAGMEYCDLAGLRAIVGLTGANGHSHDHSGRRVVLHGVAPRFKTVLNILGWDSVPGLTIDEREPRLAALR